VVAKPGAADNGRSIGYASQPAGPTLQKMTVVQRFDNPRFFELFVDLLTRPVPITLPATAN
jgi:purine nucleosidase